MSVKNSPKKERAIVALLQERTIKGAAMSVGVTEKTLHRWLHDSDFQSALHDAQRAAVGSTVRVMAEMTGVAAGTLKSVMAGAKTPPGVKVRAAEVILSRFESLRDSCDFDTRLSEVERILKLGGETGVK